MSACSRPLQESSVTYPKAINLEVRGSSGQLELAVDKHLGRAQPSYYVLPLIPVFISPILLSHLSLPRRSLPHSPLPPWVMGVGRPGGDIPFAPQRLLRVGGGGALTSGRRAGTRALAAAPPTR